MRKYLKILALMLCTCLVTVPAQPSEAAIPLAILEIIKKGVKKVIKAVDLKIQRQQNKIIWLQNAQKVLENTLSKLKLEEISEWTEKQREQYAKYFDELNRVKTIIRYYQRIRDISQKQARIVQAYQRAWSIIQDDGRFAADEIRYMAAVYEGILEKTLQNMEQLTLVASAFKTQMSDAKRLEMIYKVGRKVDENYDDLLHFNRENGMLSMSRAKTENEVALLRKLYGID